MHFNKLSDSNENSHLPHYKIIIWFIVRSLNSCVAQNSSFEYILKKRSIFIKV